MKDGSGSNRKLIPAILTVVEVANLTGFALCLHLRDLLASTFDALRAVREPEPMKVGDARLFGVEPVYDFDDGRLFFLRHFSLPRLILAGV